MQPNPKTVQLVDRIIAFAESKERDEFTRHALEREIESLKEADPAIVFAMGGVLAAANHDGPEARKKFEKARRLRPNDSWIELNYSKALYNLGCARDATETARANYIRNSDNLYVVDELIYLTMSSGRVLEARELIMRREQLKPKEEHRFTELIVELGLIYQRHNLQDDEVEALLELSLNVLRDAGYHHIESDFRAAQDGDSEWFSWSLKVAEPLEVIVDLNTQLAEIMATVEMSSELSTAFNIMYVPASA